MASYPSHLTPQISVGYSFYFNILLFGQAYIHKIRCPIKPFSILTLLCKRFHAVHSPKCHELSFLPALWTCGLGSLFVRVSAEYSALLYVVIYGSYSSLSSTFLKILLKKLLVRISRY